MKIIKEIIKYEGRLYFKSNKFVMPLVVLLCFLYFSYTIAPIDIVDMFTMSSVFTFFLMVWVGCSYSDSENTALKQIIILKVQSEKRVYISEMLFLNILGVMAGGISMLVAVTQNVVSDFHLFSRALTIQDVVKGFILHVLCAFMGGAIGSFFHPRIVNRKLAVLCCTLMSILAVTKEAIGSTFLPFRLISWLFPPISNVIRIFAGADSLHVRGVLISSLLLGIYGTIFYGLRVYILCKKKF